MQTDQLFQYIELLSRNDKKSLTQKNLKLVEEVGELAKKVLPFEGAHGTNHRVVDKLSILKECADVFLVVSSMIYDLDYTFEEFKDVIFEKSQVWNSLQIKEDRASSHSEKMPFEIHITIKAEDGINVEEFKTNCKTLNVKPIVLALQDQKATKVMDDVMTSSKFFGNNGEAITEMKRISNGMAKLGYKVIREKIEAGFWHQKAPFKADGDTKMPEGCYFECHFNVECSNDKLPRLSEISKELDCHLSKNMFKDYGDGLFTIMMTYRSYTQMYEDFEEHLEKIKSTLKLSNFKLEKEIVEFSIYDTKIDHDSKWLNA